MGYQLAYDPFNRILVLSLHGRVNDQTMLRVYHLLGSCWGYYGACSYILDLTEATDISVASTTMKEIVKRKPNLLPLVAHGAVAPSKAAQKMMRVFQFLTVNTRPTFQVFGSMSEALRLMNVPPDKFAPMKEDFPEVA
jgi:hypothetical protein